MQAPAVDFRTYLQNELVRRTKANPRYSLRAFARSLGVQSGFLSKLLLGQRNITVASIRRFGPILGLTPSELDHYVAQVSAASPDVKTTSKLQFKQLTYDQFQIIAEWYHFAILELASVQGFEPSARWIGRKLGISAPEAQDAIDRLIRLQYIKIGPRGRWIISEAHTTTLGTAETASALRRMQKQFLEMAITALETVPVAKRDQSTMTMAISTEKIPQAKEKIKKFRRELCALLESGKTQDEVYQLSISLYPSSIAL